jgi:Methylase involved in ubiquinone/menaquinone biosynthesis
MTANPFEQSASQYDQWFDTEKGQFLFAKELACLRKVMGATEGRWLEVGVGPGRFAESLGFACGIDVSPAMVELSRCRGIDARLASGDDIPFGDGEFDGVALICTLCFLPSPAGVFRECRRVLKKTGTLILAYIPADSPYGVYNAMRGKQEHSYYSQAHFYTSAAVVTMAKNCGFIFAEQSGCILPEVSLTGNEEVKTQESFVAARFSCTPL